MQPHTGSSRRNAQALSEGCSLEVFQHRQANDLLISKRHQRQQRGDLFIALQRMPWIGSRLRDEHEAIEDILLADGQGLLRCQTTERDFSACVLSQFDLLTPYHIHRDTQQPGDRLPCGSKAASMIKRLDDRFLQDFDSQAARVGSSVQAHTSRVQADTAKQGLNVLLDAFDQAQSAVGISARGMCRHVITHGVFISLQRYFLHIAMMVGWNVPAYIFNAGMSNVTSIRFYL